MNSECPPPETDIRILGLCPTRADARVMRRLLDSAGVAFEVFDDADGFCAALAPETGVLLMSEEAVLGPAAACAQELLAAQEDWSSIPLIVLTGGMLTGPPADVPRGLEAHARVILVERPVRQAVLDTVVRMAVADRLQQFRVRDLLAERAEAITRRDDFLAMLGHELRNPLGAASLCAEVMAQAPNGQQAEECTQIIQTQIQDMKRLLDDLLDISRLTRDRLALRREPMELGRILREVVMQMSHAFDECHQRLHLHLPGGELPIHGDATRLRQVFGNLLSNACRYAPPDTEVILAAEREGTGVLVRVRDQGDGMTRETLDRLFEPFWQATESGGRDGLGIGLTLARRLVEMHEGRLEARSEGLGLGSELRVSLPLSEPSRTLASASEGLARVPGN